MDPLALLRERHGDVPRAPGSAAAYTADVVEGVVEHRDAIDALITAHLSAGWTLPRLPAVDRALLRIAAYELRYGADVPAGVAISEAVGLAGDLSTDESPGYLNGVLSAIAAAPRVVVAAAPRVVVAGEPRDVVAATPRESVADELAGVGREHAPVDEAFGEMGRGVVVDDGK